MGTFANIILNKLGKVKDLFLLLIMFGEITIGLVYGLDFWVQSPVSTNFGWNKRWQMAYFRRTFMRRLTNMELIQKAEKFVVDRNIPIVADSAEPDRIREFQNHGFLLQPSC